MPGQGGLTSKVSSLNRAPKGCCTKNFQDTSYLRPLWLRNRHADRQETKEQPCPHMRSLLLPPLPASTLLFQVGHMRLNSPHDPCIKSAQAPLPGKKETVLKGRLSERGSWKASRLGELPETPACCLGGGFTIAGLWVSLSPWRRSVHAWAEKWAA